MEKLVEFLTQRGWTNERVKTLIANPHLVDDLDAKLSFISLGLDTFGLSKSDFTITLEPITGLIVNIPEYLELKFPSLKDKRQGGNLHHFNLENLLRDYKGYDIGARDVLPMSFHHYESKRKPNSSGGNESFKALLKLFGLYKEHNIVDALTVASDLINSGKIKTLKSVVIYLEMRSCLMTRYLEISFRPKGDNCDEDRTLIEYWDTGNDEDHPSDCYVVS